DDYLLRAAMAPIRFLRAPDASVYYCQHAGVRRATPGKPGESLIQGMEKRLFADLAIREAVYERLLAEGRAMKYRYAFKRWQRRLRDRYRAILDTAPLGGPLFAWLAAADDDVAMALPSWPWSTRHPRKSFRHGKRAPAGSAATAELCSRG